MKDMGVNAIRTTHNPASEQTLNIAAELGLMVQEEAFDTWYGGKKQYDYGRFFEKDATHPEARKGGYLVRLRSTDHGRAGQEQSFYCDVVNR